MSWCPTFNFQFWIMSKWLAKHISTKVSFKITIRKKHVYFGIGWPRIWNQCFYLGIWNDNRTKMIALPSFQLATRLNSQKTNETEFIKKQWHINMFMNIGIFNLHIWSFDLRNCCFWLYFSSLHDYWNPSTWNPLVHTSWGETEGCKNVLFSSSKCEKKNQLKNKNHMRNRLFIDS
jgi:hypothetical protein